MKRHLKTLAACLAFFSLSVQSLLAAAPVVSNIRAVQLPGTYLVEILYDVTASDSVNIHVVVSNDGGMTYLVPAVTFSGDYGMEVQPGLNKRIVWDAGLDWPGYFTNRGKVRVTAQQSSQPPGVPSDMEMVPAGEFAMGDPPATFVYVDTFYMDRFEVTYALWMDVFSWAIANGYSFANAGSGHGPDHPVHSITWEDAIKWCNARSEREGRTPVYYRDIGQTIVLRSSLGVNHWDYVDGYVKAGADGYRLPTAAEWEKAARGGLQQHHYPWPSFNGLNTGYENFIDGSMANYNGSEHGFRDLIPPTTPVGYYNGQQTPAGTDMANGYGLYDMAGNVREWIWERSPSSPRRRTKGGAWVDALSLLRCVQRVDPVHDAYDHTGFRTVVSAP